MSLEGSRESGEGQRVNVHPVCFHPGICLFYREPEPAASQVSLIPDERIWGVGPGILAPGQVFQLLLGLGLRW